MCIRDRSYTQSIAINKVNLNSTEFKNIYRDALAGDGTKAVSYTHLAIGSERRNKIGSGDRSEKIRTYNYPQNRVTDHRIGLTIQQLDRIMEGKLEEIIEALINEDQRLKLAGEEE